MFAEFVEVSCEMEISNSVFEDNSAPTGSVHFLVISKLLMKVKVLINSYYS